MKKFIPLFLLLFSMIVVKADDTKAYIKKYRKIAVKEMKQYGVPASITLAQGILESGSGKSRLAVKARNHFGIKCTSEWHGKTMRADDDQKNECFRKYRKAEHSFRDHSEFLANRARYKELFELDKRDYKAWASGLKKAGYATNPNYPQLLINLIEKYDLQEYDERSARKRIRREDKLEKQQKAAPVPVKASDSTIVHVVQKGDTLYSISKKYNINLDELKKLNKKNGNEVYIGETLKIR